MRRDLKRQERGIEQVCKRFTEAAKGQVAAWRGRLAELERLRQTLGYEATLQRGFAVVRDGTKVVTRKAGVGAMSVLEIQFADGRIDVVAEPESKAEGRLKG